MRYVGDSGAQALAVLVEAPLLHTLTPRLLDNSVGDSGAQEPATLKEATLLHTQSLGQFSRSQWGQVLAVLKEAPWLHTQTLNLGYNSGGDGGAQALTALTANHVFMARALQLGHPVGLSTTRIDTCR